MSVHLLYCVWCRRYAAQLQFLRKASRQLSPQALETELQKLSPEQKEQMRVRLQESLKNLPPSR